MKLTVTPQRNSLYPITVAALLQTRDFLGNQGKSAASVDVPVDLISAVKKMKSNAIISDAEKEVP